MGIFDKIKLSLGRTKIKIVLKEDNTNFNQGDLIIGKVIITGGNEGQTITNLSLRLMVKFSETLETIHEYADGSTYVEDEDTKAITEVLDEIVEDNPIKVGKSDVELDFEFKIPYNVDISMENEAEYYIYAIADLNSIIKPKDRVDIKINPSYEIQAIEYVLEEKFGFEFLGEFSQNGRIMVEFAGGSYHPNNFGLTMINMETGIEIELYPELSNMSFADFIRSDLTHESVKYQIDLGYDQIMTKSDEVDVDIVADIFKRVFKDLKW